MPFGLQGLREWRSFCVAEKSDGIRSLIASPAEPVTAARLAARGP
jgi:hypothetical protein